MSDNREAIGVEINGVYYLIDQEELDEEREYYESRCNEGDSYEYFQNSSYSNSTDDGLAVAKKRVWDAMMEYEALIGAWSE